MRCNTGVDPKLLADAHLIAEYYELAMAPGQLRKQNFLIKGPIKPEFSLGGFTVNYPALDLSGVPDKFMNDWQPVLVDSMIVRARIAERLLLKPDWYRFNRQKIGASNMDKFVNQIIDSPCFHV